MAAIVASPCEYCEILKDCFPKDDFLAIAAIVHENKHISELIKLCENYMYGDGRRNIAQLYSIVQIAHGNRVSNSEIMLLLSNAYTKSDERDKYFWAVFKTACKRGNINTVIEITSISHPFVIVTRESLIYCAAEYQNAQLLKELSFLSDGRGKLMNFGCAISAAIKCDKDSLLKDLLKLIDVKLDYVESLKTAAKYGNIISASYIFGLATLAITLPIAEIVQVAIDNGQYDFAYKFIKQFGIKLQDLKLAKDEQINAFMHRLL
ncbi:MAG: hypothetical protein M0R33_18785 [Methylomonas sp.]|jgi:hypothetical protein|uniref:hypothetical protein n=1 Tax=Methylomonas sp. TaxID=418 RepID=UPI0025FF8D07|nr:hypothetical protein [Methylomonas sp.]MCK9608491.1 hypothetical protein [Methylomonas sp.]